MSEPDFLDEDAPISNQKYFLLSYLLNKGEDSVPMVKVRGSFPDIESCQKRVKKLQAVDTYFNIFICEVGKWGGLFKDEDVAKMDDIDVEYRENTLNELMKSYIENRDTATTQFEQRKKEMKQRAIEEGSQEGQKILAEQPEEPFVVAERIKTLEETIVVYKQNIEELNKKIEETSVKKQAEEDKYAAFSEEEKAASVPQIV